MAREMSSFAAAEAVLLPGIRSENPYVAQVRHADVCAIV